MRGLLRALYCLILVAMTTSPALAKGKIPDKLTVLFRSGSSVFVSGSEDKPTGFDVDLVERFIAWNASHGGPFAIYRRGFVHDMKSLLDAVKAGKCDAAVGSVTATEERDQFVDFSDPYLPVRLVLMAPKAHLPVGPYQQSLAGKTIGAIVGSTSAERVRELSREVPQLQTRTDYPSNDELFRDLLAKPPRLDAVVTDITHYWDLSRRENIVMVAPMGPEQGLAVVFPEGSPLRERVNTFLSEFLHTPSYYHLVRKYFGEGAAKMIHAAQTK